MTALPTRTGTPAPRISRGAGARRHRPWWVRLLTRLGWVLLVVWAAVSLTFVLARIVPADPARLAAGLNAGPEQVAQVRHELGLDLPLWQQYFQYLGGIVRLDFGESIQSRQPVLADILHFLPPTLELVLCAFVLYAVLGVVLGVIWAAVPRGIHTRVINALSVIGAAVPVFWIGLLLQLVVASTFHLLPVGDSLDYSAYGMTRYTGFSVLDALLNGNTYALGDAVAHLVLPVVALVVSQLGIAIRLTRTSLSEELTKPYVRVAGARGESRWRVVVLGALRNAAAPVITMLGLQFGWLLGGTILVEVVFSWPGLGLYAYNAFRTFDYNPILAITLVITLTFVVVNEVTDLIIRRLDPRLKELS